MVSVKDSSKTSQAYSPGTMVGSTIAFDEQEFFRDSEVEEEITLGPEFFVFTENGYNLNNGQEEGITFVSYPRVQRWDSLTTESQTQIDFTPFLERLDSTTDKQMMQLLARCFHDRITVYKNDKKIFSIHEDFTSDQQNQIQVENDIGLGTRVIVTIDLENRNSPQMVRDFIEEADYLLDNREDLKLALRAVFPPTIAAAGFADPIFSSPLARGPGRKKRRTARNNRISATIKGLYAQEDIESESRKRYKKRGRPRKNPFDVNDRYKGLVEAKTNRKRRDGPDEEWKPEKKRVKNVKKSESNDKKSTKAKTPNEKAKEEADLAGMGIDKLEEHILSLQQQMRNVKHKHRKGTICPRCTTEQRLKLAFKAKNRAQCEIKVQARSPVQAPTKHDTLPLVLTKSTRRSKSEVVSNITPPVTRPKPPLSLASKATKLGFLKGGDFRTGCYSKEKK